MVVVVGLLYFLIDSALSALLVSLSPNPSQGTGFKPSHQTIPLIRIVKRLFATVFARLILFVLGFWWIPVEVVNEKRGYVSPKYQIFYPLNRTTADGIRQTKAGTHARGISSSQTGCHGSNSCGSHSGAPNFPTHPTLVLTAGVPAQVRSNIRPPNHRPRPTRLRHLDPNRPKTRPSNRNRLSRNLKLCYICL